MRYQLLSCSSDFASSNKIIVVMHNQLNVYASNLIFVVLLLLFWCLAILLLVSSEASHCMCAAIQPW